jgi:hypothetical protein
MRRQLPVLLVLLLGACFPESPPADNTGAEPEDTLPAPPFSLETLPPDSPVPERPAATQPARPAQRTDTISIEGMPQEERLTLVRSPAEFIPPFSTYVPAGMRAEFMPGDSTPSVRFVAAFAGRVNPEAYLQVRVYPRGAAELVVRQAADAYLRGRDPRQDNVRESERWPWAIDGYDFSYGGQEGTAYFIGTMAIARHGNRYLHVLAHYPGEYGDGMGPRVERILREWRWEDDGAMLTVGR